MLSVIIVNWNAKDLIDKCLNSIYEKLKKIDYEIIVVDNHSSDGSVELINNKHKGVVLINSGGNYGFAKANNMGLKVAKGEKILFLNPDTEFIEEFDVKMLEAIDNEGVILGAKLLNSDRSIQYSPSFFPSPLRLLFGRLALKKQEELNRTQLVDWIMGAFMLLKKSDALAVGGFSEEYFMYAEDKELCYSLKKKGVKTLYYADYSIVHHYNQSGALKWKNLRNDKVFQADIKFLKNNYNSLCAIICIGCTYVRKFVSNFRF